jgi:hypothetical protein
MKLKRPLKPMSCNHDSQRLMDLGFLKPGSRAGGCPEVWQTAGQLAASSGSKVTGELPRCTGVNGGG